MITKAILELYQRFEGSQGSYVGAATPNELTINGGCDWDDIEIILQDILLMGKCLAVPTTIENVRIKCDSEETFKHLKEIALDNGYFSSESDDSVECRLYNLCFPSTANYISAFD
jgi:hypothetical protein